MILKSLASAFLTLSTVLPIECKVSKCYHQCKYLKTSFLGIEANHLKRYSGPKMDPWKTPAIVSDHEL